MTREEDEGGNNTMEEETQGWANRAEPTKGGWVNNRAVDKYSNGMGAITTYWQDDISHVCN